ncbi:NADAR family protein [Oscillibacter sp.]|uniref:NADAR family protein n=1 Tax=Oscillibacter sp. TaxID=1945593 RepID=UPI0028989A09|nr:NADAR family protein [Oscillibacter sp.]
MYGNEQIRTYNISNCIAFRKTSEAFGGLSNMAPNYKIDIYDIHFLTAEALYQACRFPNHPEIQQQIIKQHSPMYAKDVSKKYANLTRSDWEQERVKIMRWAIRAKLLCNWHDFGELLKSTVGKTIVEDSSKDVFWGAKKEDDSFVGVNALGRLLMQLREQYLLLENKSLISLPPPEIENFIIMGRQIETIQVDVTKQLYGRNEKMW